MVLHCSSIHSPNEGYFHCIQDLAIMKIAAAAKSLQSCPTLCNPMDCNLPGSSDHGIFHARVLEMGCHCLLWQLWRKLLSTRKKKTWFLLTSTWLWSQLTFPRPPGWAWAAWLLCVFSWDVGYLLQALSYPCGFHPPLPMQPSAARTLIPGPQTLTASSDTNTNWKSCVFQHSFVHYLANSSCL